MQSALYHTQVAAREEPSDAPSMEAALHFDPSLASLPSNEDQVLNHERQKAATALDRFEAFVTDNLGLLAPTFAHTRLPSTELAKDYFLNETGSSYTSQSVVDVQMEGRETFELEKRFGEISPEDIAYLNSKGLVARQFS